MMNKDIVFAKIAGVDTGEALKRLRGNTSLYIRMFGLLFEEKELKALQEAVANGDAPTAASCAHTIKGAAANLSAKSLVAKSAEIEASLKESTSISQKHLDVLAEIESIYKDMHRDFLPYL